jgi:hypothetical protein
MLLFKYGKFLGNILGHEGKTFGSPIAEIGDFDAYI